MPQRLLTVSTIALAAGLACAGAWALGFGPVRAMATIGQPLDASVVVRLQPGETLTDNCVSATVSSGDNPIPPALVTASFVQPPGAEARVRVRTSARIDEPFVNLVVTIGCETRVTRQFTVFVDPPPLAVALESSAAPAVPVQPVAPFAVAEAASSPSSDVVVGGAAPPPRSGGRRSSGTVQRAEGERTTTVVAVNRSRAAAVAGEAPVTAAPEGKAERAQAARISGGAVTRSEGVARLRLDSAVVSAPPENPLVKATQQREQALATAKIAVDVAEAANSSAAQKISEMEAQLASARQEVADAKAALARLQAERTAAAAAAASAAAAAAAADEGPFSGYSTWLAGACGVLLLLSGALFWRLRRSDSERLQSWLKENSRFSRLSEFDTVAPVTEQFPDSIRTASPIPSDMAETRAPAAATAATAAAAAARAQRPRPAEPEPPQTLAPLPPLPDPRPTFTETQPSSTLELDQGSHGHDISIEELLDVEQQAEFFVVLGQDDAAIDLLTSHVMASGGASPMPYLKLLEIYRRIGDQTSYERTRKRFNARFNGLAPEWAADPNGGRTLDEYPDVVRRLQAVWADPVDAMAELQTLMFRNDSNLLFELPAYRDIMLLFTLARDLHDSTDHSQAPVDVLLPLGTTGPAPTPALPTLPTLPTLPETPDPFGAGGLRLVVEDSEGVQASGGRR